MSDQIACHACDLLVDLDRDEGVLHCPRCQSVLTRLAPQALQRCLASAITATILLGVSVSFPFIAFSAQGISSEVTLLQTPAILWQYGRPGVALMVASFVLIIPAVVLFLVIEISHALLFDHRYLGLITSTRLLFSLYHWSMAEVFIIGVMVSMIKIVKLADISLGISFWSYVAFGLCFTATLASLDRYAIWTHLDELKEVPALES